MKKTVLHQELTIDDYLKEWLNEIDIMKKSIETRKKDFRRIYLPHIGSFFHVLDMFERRLKRTIKELNDIPIEDVKLELDKMMRWIKENYYALKTKLNASQDSLDLLIEAIVIDISTSLGYYGCYPLIILNDKITSIKAHPIVIKERRDPNDPVIMTANPIIAKKFLITPLIGHEVAHMLEKEHEDKFEKNYPEEICCDYLATIIFGISYILAQIKYVSEIKKDDLYNIQEETHPPREYRITNTINFLEKRIKANVKKQIKQAYDKIKTEWKDKLLKNPPSKKYATTIQAMKLDVWNDIALKHLKGIINHYSIDEEMLIHNNHSQGCPLSWIHNSSLNFIINGKEDKTIKSKILDYAKKIN